jgi:hypothetical protein
LLGEIHLAPQPPETDDAEANFNHALDLATTLGMRPLVAHCYEGFSRLHAKRGEQARADQALTQARAIWSSLGC